MPLSIPTVCPDNSKHEKSGTVHGFKTATKPKSVSFCQTNKNWKIFNASFFSPIITHSFIFERFLWTVNNRIITAPIPVTYAVTKFNLTMTRKMSTTRNNVCFLFCERQYFPTKHNWYYNREPINKGGIKNSDNKAPIFYEWLAHLSLAPAALIWIFSLSRHFIHICKWPAVTQLPLYHSESSKKKMRSFKHRSLKE